MTATADTAFVYDFMLVEGGAESLTLHVLRQFPEIDLVTGFVNEEVFPLGKLPANTQALTSKTAVRGWQGLKTMAAFDRKGGCLSEYRTVVFSGVYAPVGVAHRPNGHNLYYCHTPPRFAYDLAAFYRQQASPWQRPLLDWLARHVRRRFEHAIRQMDTVIANSRNVAARLSQLPGVQVDHVIYPPVDTHDYRWLEDGDFFLSTARLEPYKRVDRIISAFLAMPDQKLVVASGGSDAQRLRKMAAGAANIHFTDWLPAPAIRDLTGRCRATLYLPEDEDFGISPVESMAAGKPVIGVAEGGLLETIRPGETGLLLDPAVIRNGGEDAVSAITSAVARLSTAAKGMREACEAQAGNFSRDVFDRAFSALIPAR